jgi:hypothetical protein
LFEAGKHDALPVGVETCFAERIDDGGLFEA